MCVCIRIHVHKIPSRIVVLTDGVEKKSNNGIKQDFEETDYEVDIVIKKIYKKSLKTVFSVLLTFLCVRLVHRNEQGKT